MPSASSLYAVSGSPLKQLKKICHFVGPEKKKSHNYSLRFSTKSADQKHEETKHNSSDIYPVWTQNE